MFLFGKTSESKYHFELTLLTLTCSSALYAGTEMAIQWSRGSQSVRTELCPPSTWKTYTFPPQPLVLVTSIQSRKGRVQSCTSTLKVKRRVNGELRTFGRLELELGRFCASEAVEETMELTLQGCDDRGAKLSFTIKGRCLKDEGLPPLTPTTADVTSAQPRPLRLFGGPLSNGITRSRSSVPVVVYVCVQYLVYHGLKAEGLFTVSPSPVLVEAAKAAFEEGKSVNISDPHVTAAVLLSYFRELREPLLPSEAFRQLSTVNSDKEASYARLKEAVEGLEKDNRVVLSFLLHFLTQVSAHHSVNGMTVRKLAVVWAPALVWGLTPSSHYMLLSAAQCVDALLVGYARIFPEGPPRPFAVAVEYRFELTPSRLTFSDPTWAHASIAVAWTAGPHTSSSLFCSPSTPTSYSFPPNSLIVHCSMLVKGDGVFKSILSTVSVQTRLDGETRTLGHLELDLSIYCGDTGVEESVEAVLLDCSDRGAKLSFIIKGRRLDQPAGEGVHAEDGVSEKQSEGSSGELRDVSEPSLTSLPQLEEAELACNKPTSSPFISYSHSQSSAAASLAPLVKPLRLFGGSLSDGLARCRSSVPVVVYVCVEYLTYHGLRAPGLFTASPAVEVVDAAKAAFEEGKGLNLDDPHVAAAVLLSYFEELRKPLILSEAFRLSSTVDINEEASYARLKQAVDSLEENNRVVLSFLLHFLTKVVAHHSINGMTARRLAEVWAPILIVGRTRSTSHGSQISATDRVAALLHAYTRFFPEGPPVPFATSLYRFELTPSRLTFSEPDWAHARLGLRWTTEHQTSTSPFCSPSTPTSCSFPSTSLGAHTSMLVKREGSFTPLPSTLVLTSWLDGKTRTLGYVNLDLTDYCGHGDVEKSVEAPLLLCSDHDAKLSFTIRGRYVAQPTGAPSSVGSSGEPTDGSGSSLHLAVQHALVAVQDDLSPLTDSPFSSSSPSSSQLRAEARGEGEGENTARTDASLPSSPLFLVSTDALSPSSIDSAADTAPPTSESVAFLHSQLDAWQRLQPLSSHLSFLERAHACEAHLAALVSAQQSRAAWAAAHDSILTSPTLSSYFTFFQLTLIDVMTACKAVHSGWVSCGYTNAKDHVISGLGLAFDHAPLNIPGAALLNAVLQWANDRPKSLAVNAMAVWCISHEDWTRFVAHLAVLVCGVKREAIGAAGGGGGDGDEGKGILQRLKEGGEAAVRALTADDKDTPVKRMADDDARRLCWAIMKEEMQPLYSTQGRDVHDALQRAVYEVMERKYTMQEWEEEETSDSHGEMTLAGVEVSCTLPLLAPPTVGLVVVTAEFSSTAPPLPLRPSRMKLSSGDAEMSAALRQAQTAVQAQMAALEALIGRERELRLQMEEKLQEADEARHRLTEQVEQQQRQLHALQAKSPPPAGGLVDADCQALATLTSESVGVQSGADATQMKREMAEMQRQLTLVTSQLMRLMDDLQRPPSPSSSTASHQHRTDEMARRRDEEVQKAALLARLQHRDDGHHRSSRDDFR